MHKWVYRFSLALLFVVPWDAAVLISGLGTASKVIGFMLVGAWIVEQLVTNRFPPLHRFHLLIVALFFWVGASVAWTTDTRDAVVGIGTWAQLVGLVLILWDLYRTEESIREGLQAFVLGGYVAAASTLYNFLTAEETFRTVTRAAATNFNPNKTAMILVLAIPMAWSLATTVSSPGRAWRAINYGFIPVAIVAVALSSSRTALFASVPVAIFLIGQVSRASAAVRSGLVLVGMVSVFLTVSVVPESSFERFSSAGDEFSSRDFNGRASVWSDGIDLLIANPVIGVGLGSYSELTRTGQGGHNSFLQIAVETGVVGFVLFSTIVAIAFIAALRLRRSGASLWLTLLSAWILGSMVHSWQDEKFTWIILALTMSTAEAGFSRKQRSTNLQTGRQARVALRSPWR